MMKQNSSKIYKPKSSSSDMFKKSSLVILCFMFIFISLSFASAEIDQAKDTNLTFSITSNFADNCTLTNLDKPSGINIINQVGDKSSQTFSFNLTSGNFSDIGSYKAHIECTDGTTTVTQYEDIEVTPNGESLNIQTAMMQIILLGFFIVLGFGFYFLSNKVDLEKWNKSIYKRYENRNYVKLVLSSIGYNLMKNAFVIYYLIGLPILITLTDISYAYGLDNLVDILKALLIIYTSGIIVVAIVLFSHVQEWIMDLLEEIKNMDWGIQ